MKQNGPQSKPFQELMGLFFFWLIMSSMAAPAAPSAVVAPRALASNDMPFASWILQVPNLRFQEVYAAEHFPDTGMLITELRFRPDSTYGRAFTSVVEHIPNARSSKTRPPRRSGWPRFASVTGPSPPHGSPAPAAAINWKKRP